MPSTQWTNANGGDWSITSNWSTDLVPTSSDDVLINLVTGQPYTVTVNSASFALSLTLDSADATVQLNSTLTIGTSLTLNSGAFQLQSTGTLVGGTIIGSGMVFQSGTLSGVTNEGTLDLSASDARITVSNGITLTGSGGVGPGSIVVTGSGSYLNFTGTQIVDNASIGIGSAVGYASLYATGGGTLTFETGVSITHAGSYAYTYIGGSNSILNRGTIDAGYTLGSFVIDGNGIFANEGLVRIDSGDTIRARTTVTGTGTFAIGGGGFLAMYDPVSSGLTVDFGNSSGALILVNPSSFGAGVVGFGSADTIDFQGIGLATSYTFVGGVLTLSNAIAPAIAQVTLSTPLISPVFSLISDGSTGTLLGVSGAAAGTYTSGIVLSNPANQNPTTFPSYWYITNNTASYNGDAVYGTSATGWTVTTSGTINATQPGASGIHLANGGSVTNSGLIAGDFALHIDGAPGTVVNYGTIAGGTEGVQLNSGGLVINGPSGAGTALITGYFAVAIAGGAGTVVNYGTIERAGVGGAAILMLSGGTVTNQATGLINGPLYGDAVRVDGGAGTIANYGTIAGVSEGVVLNAGGLVTNGPGGAYSALISGDANGVMIAGAVGTVANYGTVTASAGFGASVYLALGGSVVNGNGGATAASIIGNSNAVAIFNAPGNVTNYGTLAAIGAGGYGAVLNAGGTVANFGTIVQTGAHGAGVALVGAGIVTNAPGATIGGYLAGVEFFGGPATVVNYGSIFGSSGRGVYFSLGGSVYNSGLISGATDVVLIRTPAATVTNTGTIIGTAGPGIWLADGGFVNNSGLVSGFDDALFFGYTPGVVVNYGTIENTGTYGDGVCLDAGGFVSNAAGGTITGQSAGVEIQNAVGTVVNYGTIATTNPYGEGVYLGLGGTLTNGSAAITSAYIIGGHDGASLRGAGGNVVNYGTIASTSSSTGVGVHIALGGTVSNGAAGSTSALIDADRLGVYIGGNFGIRYPGAIGTVINFGTIEGSAIYVVSLVSGGAVVNHGTIAGSGSSVGGVYLGGAPGTVVNYGTIAGSGAYGDGIRLAAGGLLTNSALGLIAGPSIGVDIQNAEGTVINDGTIIGAAIASTGIWLVNGGTVVNGSGSNPDALIVGDADGVVIGSYPDGGLGTVTNYGTIDGATVAVWLVGGGTVVNFGTITSFGTYGDGIAVGELEGMVSNVGLITANNLGVWLQAGGFVANSGTITGADRAVFIEGTAGTVVSDGTIGGSGGTGVSLEAGGLVRNNIGGVIDGYYVGVSFSYLPGTVLNYSTIAATATGTYANATAVYLGAGGQVTNQQYAVIQGGSGLDIRGLGTVDNLGTIAGTAAYGGGIAATLGGTVTNGSSPVTNAAIIGSQIGVAVSGDLGTVTNYGTIAASNTSSSAVYLHSGGVVYNRQSGIISAGGDGIDIFGATGQVTNLGTVIGTAGSGVLLAAGGTVANGTAGVGGAVITGGFAGVNLLDGGGTVTNGAPGVAATIGGGTYGVFSRDAAATIVNYGTIGGTIGSGIFLYAGGSVTNGAPGSALALITGYSDGVAAQAVSGTVTNFGTIAAHTRGVALGSGGTVTNLGAISGTAHTGVYLGAAGTIVNGATTATGASIIGYYVGIGVAHGAGYVFNFGTIAATSAAGDGVALAGGTVVNHQFGTISGFALGIGGADRVTNYGVINAIGAAYPTGIYGAVGGLVTNFGTVTAATGGNGVAVSFAHRGVLINQAGGLLTGANRGVALGGTEATIGSIANYGTITGGDDGIVLGGAPATVTNLGAISATARFGVFFTAGGQLINGATGLIDGYKGVVASYVAVDVGNSGTIAGDGTVGFGLQLANGGTLTNAAGGLIEGGDGARINGQGSVLNSGTISGSNNYGIYLDGGSLTNTGLISGVWAGAAFGGAATVANSGTIGATGTGGTGISFSNADDTLGNSGTIAGSYLAVAFAGGDDRLIVDPIAVFSGGVDAGAGTDVLELSAGSGTLDGFGTSFTAFEQMLVDAGAAWQLTGTPSLDSGTSVVVSGSLSIAGSLTNDGAIDIGAAASLAFTGVVGGGGSIDFAGAGGTLTIAGSSMTNTISGFDPGDTIALTAFAGTIGTLDANNLLTLVGEAAYTLQFDPLQDFSGQVFQAADDGSGGTLVTVVNSAGPIIVSAGEIFIVSSGQVESGITVLGGGTLLVESGGTALGTDNSGLEVVSAGGSESGATIAGGGIQDVFGIATDTLVTGGGQQIVDPGGVASGTTVESGGTQTVSSGSTAQDAVINGGGIEQVLAGGVDSAATVNGGEQDVFGSASGAQIGSGGSQVVGAGGVGSGTAVSSGGIQLVEASGISIATTILDGGSALVLAGGAASGTVISSGGSAQVSGTASSTVVSGGGTLLVLAGGTAVGTVDNGTEILSGGTDLGGTVESGGVVVVSSGGLASGTVVHSGGLVVVSAGGSTEAVTLLGIGAVVSGVPAAQETVSSGGIASATTVSSGGRLTLSAGGSAAGTTVLSGGVEVISAGGVAVGTQLVGTGPVSSGGTAAQQTVSSGGVASATTVFSGGRLLVLDGGATAGATVFSGGVEVISSGGVAVGTVLSGNSPVSSGSTAAQQTVSSGGFASATSVFSGGRELILDGGTASGATVFDGGAEVISSGGLATGTTVSSGGRQTVSSGGTASGTIVSAGGTEIVSAGGTLVDATVFGATIELADGATAGGTIALDGVDDVLQIDGTTMPTAVIAGFDFDDAIDLADVAFVSGTMSAFLNAGNLLTVFQGGVSFALQFTPVEDFTGRAFGVLDDGAGGTEVRVFDGDFVGPGQTRVLFAGETGSDITVQSGGTLIVNSGAVASATQIEGGGVEIISAGGLDVDATVASGGFQDVAGTASGTVIIAGGSQTVEVGGDARNVVLDDAAIQDVFGFAGGTIISATDIQLVESGGVASGTVISAGGLETVFAGGLTSDTTIDGAGTLEVQNGAAFSGFVDFAGVGGLLQIDGSSVPDGFSITGFERGDRIDLRGLTSVGSFTFDPFAGTLTVSGSFVDTLQFAGLAADTAFGLVADGSGGTLVTEVPLAPSAVSLSPGSDSGAAEDNVTNDTTPTIVGLGEAGDTVSLFDGGTLVGSGTVAGDGGWTIDASALADGVHTLSATQTDGFGGVSAVSGALALAIDTTAPAVVPVSVDFLWNSSAAPIGIPAPTDPDDAADALTVTVTGLPVNGTVTLADGVTPVALAGQLTAGDLAGLEFTPATGQIGVIGVFDYTVTDPAGNTTTGSATLGIVPSPFVSLLDFVFTYVDSSDYYFGTVTDNGTYGYRVGQTIFTGPGQYAIYDDQGPTSQPPGVVSVTYYSHAGPGQASYVPETTATGLPDGADGLGSEIDSVLGIDGLSYPFDSTSPAGFATATLFGFVYTYADGRAYYTGTVADDGSFGVTDGGVVVRDGAGNLRGTYSVFTQGTTARAAGTVVVDQVIADGASYAAIHSGLTLVDGTNGLGSEVASANIGGRIISFSNSAEPQQGLSIPFPPGLVDAAFYEALYPDVAQSGIEPAVHYAIDGWLQGRDPNAYFSTTGYLAANPDVKAAGINPLGHYDTHGWKEGRDPAPDFDNEYYLVHAPDVQAAGVDPLLHYLLFGKAEDRLIAPAIGSSGVTSDGFDREFYLLSNPSAVPAGTDPHQHYLTTGWTQGLDPSAYFSTSGYLAANPDVKAAGINPLVHYGQAGWKEGRDPSPGFDPTYYLIHNPDVAAAGIEPLVHYLRFGVDEGRPILPAVGGAAQIAATDFDPSFYRLAYPDVANSGVDLFTDFATIGWQQGRDPNGLFDTSYYLESNPDVKAAGINPLDHYTRFGWREGRDPSALFDTNAYLAANPDVKAAGIDPLHHFLVDGLYEGRLP